MDKKITTALLAIGLCIFCPSIWQFIREYSFGQLSIDLVLWCIAFVVLVCSGFKDPRGALSNPLAIDSRHFVAVLLSAFLGLLVGSFIHSPTWMFSGWVMCLSAFLSVMLGFDKRQLVRLSLLSVLTPWVFWEYGTVVHWFGQRIASGLAGSVLDIAKVFYYYKGSVIGLVSAEDLEVQQCAGLRLLWLCLLIVATYGFVRKYSLARWFFLVLESLFWIVVFNAARIAYSLWLQDGQDKTLEPSFLLADTFCAVGILFLAWSGDQFYAAFFYREKDVEVEDTGGSESKASSVADQGRSVSPFWVLSFAVLVGIVGLGGWLVLQDDSSRAHRVDQQSIINALRDLKIDPQDSRWEVVDTNVPYEVLSPVFRQSEVWPQRQWLILDKNDQDKKPVMRLRIDGLWFRSPRPDWLWRWFGWEIEGLLKDQRQFTRWSMSRSIVEEGFVVSGDVYLTSSDSFGAPGLQVSLVREGFKAINEVSAIEQEELFLRFSDSLKQQLQNESGSQAKQQEAL